MLNDRPSDESLAGYFIHGLRKNLRASVANVDIAGGFEDIVVVATRVEKRLGTDSEKKRKTTRSDSGSDSDTDSESESDEDEDESSGDESGSDSSYKKKKKGKGKSPSPKTKESKKKEKKLEEEMENRVLKKLKKLGLSPPSSPEKPFCHICERTGHSTENCWYNPNCRSRIPPHINQRNNQEPPQQVNQVTPATQGRGYNGPPRNFPPRQNWQRPQNAGGQGGLVCDYCGQDGHRIGPLCEMWCKHREERGRPVIRFPEAGRGQRQPPGNPQQAPQANVVLIELPSEQEQVQMLLKEQETTTMMQHPQVCQISHNLQMECDCSVCIQIEDCEEVGALAITRAKGKEALKWEEQEKVRQRVAGQIKKVQKDQGQGTGMHLIPTNGSKWSITNSNSGSLVDNSNTEKFVEWSNELFEALMQSPLQFTLDQLLSMVPTFKQQLLQKFQAKVSDKDKSQDTPAWETFQTDSRRCGFQSTHSGSYL